MHLRLLAMQDILFAFVSIIHSIFVVVTGKDLEKVYEVAAAVSSSTMCMPLRVLAVDSVS